MPSTWLATPKTIPDCRASTVFLAITDRGRSNSTLRSWAPRRPSASSEISMPGAIAPPTYCPCSLTTSKVVAVAEVDDDGRSAVERGGGQCVDDPVRTHLARIVHQDRDAGADAGLDHHVGDRAEVRRSASPATRAGPPAPSSTRHIPVTSADSGAVGEQSVQEHRPLVRRAALVGRDPPVRHHLTGRRAARARCGCCRCRRRAGPCSVSVSRPRGPCPGRRPSPSG